MDQWSNQIRSPSRLYPDLAYWEQESSYEENQICLHCLRCVGDVHNIGSHGVSPNNCQGGDGSATPVEQLRSRPGETRHSERGAPDSHRVWTSGEQSR